MSDQNSKNKKGKVLSLAAKYTNGSLSGRPVGHYYDDEERDKVSKQFNRNSGNDLPKTTPRLEKERPVNAPQIRIPPQADLNMEYVRDDEVMEGTSTASSPAEVVEFDEADYPPANRSFQTMPTEDDESDEYNESQDEVETVNPQPQGDEKVTILKNEMRQETTARDDTQNAIKELQEKLRSKDEEIKQLQGQVKKLFMGQEMDSLNMNLLSAEIQSLKGDIEAMQANERRLKQQLAEREERIWTLEKRLAEARRENEAMAEQRRLAENAHRQELHEQKHAQIEEMGKALELIRTAQRKALRDESQSEVPASAGEFYRQRRGDLGDDYDDARFEATLGRQRADGMTLGEQLWKRRNADIEDEFRRMENQQRYQLGSVPQQSQRNQLTIRGFDDDDMRPRSSSARTHHRFGSDNNGGKKPKLSRSKRDRTKMSVTKR